MSDVNEGGELSRRALREVETGSIPVFDGPPLTRRERKMREEMIATGVIPVQTPVVDQSPDAAVTNPVMEPAVSQQPPAATQMTEAPAAVAPAIVEPEPVEAQAVPEQPARPLTRRELREQLRGRAPKKQAEPSVPAPVAAEPVVEVAPAVAPVVEPVDEATTWPVLDAPVASPVQPAVEVETITPVVDVPPPDSGEVTSVELPSAEVPVVVPPVADEPTKSPEPPEVPLPPVFGPITSRDTATAPALEVGPAAPATHALILPVAPSIDVTGPLGDTGEIIVTGNIPLPRLIAETGLTGVVDADIDDDDYSDYVDPDSGTYTQPVRALDAVSSRSLEIDQPLIQKPRWGSLAITLGVSAAILGVTAISLLALALFTNVFAL